MFYSFSYRTDTPTAKARWVLIGETTDGVFRYEQTKYTACFAVDEDGLVYGVNYTFQQGVTLEQLSEGLCTVSQLAKIEQAERLPARTLQKRLLERLGFELAGFENFLQAEEYEDWKEKILYYEEIFEK